MLDDSACAILNIVGRGSISVEFPFEPVFTEQLHRMLRPDRSIPAPKIVGGAVLVASPADSFRMLRIESQSGFRRGHF